MSDTNDWVQLTSGEWLQGTVERMRNDKIVVDSDELDELTLDWEDVEELWVPRPMECLFDDLETRVGPLHVVGDDVHVESDPPVTLPRRALLAFVPEGDGSLSRWSGKATLGYTSLSGNTDQTDLSGMLSVRRDTGPSVYKLDYTGLISSVDDKQTANNHYLRTTYTTTLSRRTYLTPVYIDAWSDKFKNIDYQVTPAVLAGYKIIDELGQEWRAGAGSGVQYTKYRSVEAGEDDTDTATVFIFQTDYEQDLTKDWDVSLSYNYQVEIGSAHDSTQRLMAQTSVDISDDFDLSLSLIWTSVGNPQPADDGEEPKNDDLSVTLGIGFEF